MGDVEHQLANGGLVCWTFKADPRRKLNLGR